MQATYNILHNVIIVANESTPVSQVGVKASVDRCVLLPVEPQMPLADSPCDVAQVLEVLRQDLTERQPPRLRRQHRIALHAWGRHAPVTALHEVAVKAKVKVKVSLCMQ